MTSRSLYVCETRVEEINYYFKQLDRYSAENESLQDFNRWANENYDIQSSRVRDYSDMIREWNSRGASRWRAKVEASSKPKAFAQRLWSIPL